MSAKKTAPKSSPKSERRNTEPKSNRGTTETESISKETLKREESPQESSIEREIHPERKPN